MFSLIGQFIGRVSEQRYSYASLSSSGKSKCCLRHDSSLNTGVSLAYLSQGSFWQYLKEDE